MKTWIVSALLFFTSITAFATSAPVGTLGTIPTVTFTDGATTKVFTTVTGYKTLLCYTDTHANCTFRDTNSTTNAGYQVPNGKSFFVHAMRYFTRTASVHEPVILQSDNDVGFDSTGSLTTPLYAGGSATAQGVLPGATGSFAPQLIEFTALQTKYLSLTGSSAAMIVYLYGFEQ